VQGLSRHLVTDYSDIQVSMSLLQILVIVVWIASCNGSIGTEIIVHVCSRVIGLHCFTWET
jgi:hypothetical protein